MRNAFADEITKLALKDDRIVLLSGDIGNRLFDNYKEKISDRFYNCGIAEANMTTVAAGLALSGLKPITYTITSFNTSRCYEQIKLDVGYHNLPVIIVGTGSGLSYSNLGSTHHSLDDISIMRSIPNMTVICPADVVELKLALKEALNLKRPVYIRIGKKNEPIIHKDAPDYKIGKGIKIADGKDCCIICTGHILPVALNARKLLLKENISVEIISMHTVKPLDYYLLEQLVKRFDMLVTFEEHSIIGGLGSSVAEWLVDNQTNCNTKLIRIATPDKFIENPGKRDSALKKTGLTEENIKNKIIEELKNGKWKN